MLRDQQIEEITWKDEKIGRAERRQNALLACTFQEWMKE